MIDELVANSLFEPESIVIDVGSWDNIKPSLTLASKGKSVIAIDRYQRMEKFKGNLEEAVRCGKIDRNIAERIQPMKADANQLPFRNNSIDGVLFWYSTSWLQQFGSEMLVVYKEVRRILKDKGVVIIVEQTADRAKEQELFLNTQMKTNRVGALIIGRKVKIEEFPLD